MIEQAFAFVLIFENEQLMTVYEGYEYLSHMIFYKVYKCTHVTCRNSDGWTIPAAPSEQQRSDRESYVRDPK
jgi:hypothetical protein